jgi:hypothetical protein
MLHTGTFTYTAIPYQPHVPLQKKYRGYRGWKIFYGIFTLMAMVTAVTLNKARLPICCMFLHYIPRIYNSTHAGNALYKTSSAALYLTSDIT